MIEAPKPVVVTGMGVVTPLGLNLETTWQGLIADRSGISSLEPPVDSRIKAAGQIKNFQPETYFSLKELGRVHRSTQLSFAAAIEALQDAGLLTGTSKDDWILANTDPDRVGLRIGTGGGGTAYAADIEDIIREKGTERISAVAMLLVLSERVVAVPSMKLNIRGPIATTVAACATGSTSIVDAVKTIRAGDADVMLAGGTDSMIDRIGIGSFAAMRALSKSENPAEASRPFDKGANGFVMAEGAGMMVLERLEHACQRGARIYAEIAGYGETADAYHETAPSGEGAIRAMRLALVKAGIESAAIDYINAHGTSTPTGDPVELKAIKTVFEECLDQILVSSTKSATGHLLGAAGVVEAIITIKVLQKGIVPPTLNLHDPIPEAEGMDLTPLRAKPKRIEYAMSNSFGFGGINSVIVFRLL